MPSSTGVAPIAAALWFVRNKMDKIIIQTDGAARGNPGPAGIGGYIYLPSGERLLSFSEYIGEATNNVAEYSALLYALKQAVKYKALKVELKLDSELIVKQLQGIYKVKNEGLKPYYFSVKALLNNYLEVEIKHIYREANAEADALANKAIDKSKAFTPDI